MDANNVNNGCLHILTVSSLFFVPDLTVRGNPCFVGGETFDGRLLFLTISDNFLLSSLPILDRNCHFYFLNIFFGKRASLGKDSFVLRLAHS
jgi:hypothetical protein